MSGSRTELERILGGRIDSLHEQPLPGLVPSAGEEVIYFACTATSSLEDQMKQLIGHVVPVIAKSGRVIATKHTLIVPDGQLFHAVAYRGDIEGWRRQITEGAKSLGVSLGRIEGGSTFVLSDGQTHPLSDCTHGIA